MPAMETVPHADDIAADCRPGASAAGSDADFGVVTSSFGPPWKLALTGGVAVAVAVGTWVVVRAAVAGTLVLATRGDRRRWWVRFAADVIELALGVAFIARLVDTVHAAALTLGAIAVRAGTIEIATAVIHMRRPRPASVEVNASPMGV
ncbi:MAG: hypothetical protein JWM72_4475 [Actinomycetia bacterium]|nr:hypothetical protein [Actinomycetes bacterium]